MLETKGDEANTKPVKMAVEDPHQAAQKQIEETPFPISSMPEKGLGQRCWGQMYNEKRGEIGKMM